MRAKRIVYDVIVQYTCFKDIEKQVCGCKTIWGYVHLDSRGDYWGSFDEKERGKYDPCPHCEHGMRRGPFLLETYNCDVCLEKKRKEAHLAENDEASPFRSRRIEARRKR